MNDYMKDWKNINTNHDDDLDFKTMFVSVGLAICLVLALLIGGAL